MRQRGASVKITSDVEREMLFVAISADCSLVVTAVAGVKHDDFCTNPTN